MERMLTFWGDLTWDNNAWEGLVRSRVDLLIESIEHEIDDDTPRHTAAVGAVQRFSESLLEALDEAGTLSHAVRAQIDLFVRAVERHDFEKVCS